MDCYVMQAAGKNPLSTRQSLPKLRTNEMGTESNPVVVSVNNDKLKNELNKQTQSTTNNQRAHIFPVGVNRRTRRVLRIRVGSGIVIV